MRQCDYHTSLRIAKDMMRAVNSNENPPFALETNFDSAAICKHLALFQAIRQCLIINLSRPRHGRRLKKYPPDSNSCVPVKFSARLHKTLQNHLPSRFIEIDRQLVAIDRRHRAIAEFDVEHPRAFRKGRGGA
jgi:hypothetical protein